MASRKDYRRIARLIKTERSNISHDTNVTDDDMCLALAAVARVARGLATYLGEENPAFNRSMFLEACGVRDIESIAV